jgi:hypothetical protein
MEAPFSQDFLASQNSILDILQMADHLDTTE